MVQSARFSFARLTLHNSLVEGASCRADPAFIRENLFPQSRVSSTSRAYPLCLVLLPFWSGPIAANQVDWNSLTRCTGYRNPAWAGRVRPTGPAIRGQDQRHGRRPERKLRFLRPSEACTGRTSRPGIGVRQERALPLCGCRCLVPFNSRSPQRVLRAKPGSEYCILVKPWRCRRSL